MSATILRISFDEFIEKYFHAHMDPETFRYFNKDGEELNKAIAREFYQEYCQSGISLARYIKETTFKSE